MNELSLIFQALNIDTGDVLAAARTKWNFMPFQPGLVGGHCIGVDPYYLTYRAEKAGYHPEVILAGRRINDGMGQRVARECVRRLLRRKAQNGIVTILGLTFKEDVPDTRNSRVIDIVRELQSFGLTVQIHDPLANAADARYEYGVKLTELHALQPADAVVLAVAHQHYMLGGWPFIQQMLREGSGLVLDVKARLDRAATPAGVELWRL
jgi:UDP-N-acetyl-D-glucosamine/UDP-N-acetyl-D-galactosamine dehydrogenase